MSDLELREVLQDWRLGKVKFSEMFEAVQRYSSASNNGNVIVSRSAAEELVTEAERRVAKQILWDIELGYDVGMIENKIKDGSYVGSSLETYRWYKRHFG